MAGVAVSGVLIDGTVETDRVVTQIANVEVSVRCSVNDDREWFVLTFTFMHRHLKITVYPTVANSTVFHCVNLCFHLPASATVASRSHQEAARDDSRGLANVRPHAVAYRDSHEGCSLVVRKCHR